MYFGGYSTGILSTFNRGTTSPGSATYTRMDGTSMAAPMVSAAAALLYSAGMKTPDQVEAGLRAALHPFPNYENDYAWFNCKPADPEFYDCGDGILDLGGLDQSSLGYFPSLIVSPVQPERQGDVCGDPRAVGPHLVRGILQGRSEMPLGRCRFTSPYVQTT